MSSLISVDAVSLLPEELWSDILQRTSGNFQDMLSCYMTCRLWKNLLETTAATWMFEMLFPHLFQYLPKADILQCRVVCKTWCTAVDSFLEEQQPILNEIEHGQVRCRGLEVDFHRSAARMKIPIQQAMRLFQEQFLNHSRGNPFVSRSVHLTWMELRPNTVDFLDKFGSHIWHINLTSLSVNMRLGRDSLRNLARHIWDILHRLPNLKKLKLASLNAFLNHRIHPALDQSLDAFIATNPVPTLPLLKCVDVACIDPPKLRHVLVAAYASQVTSLHLSSCMELSWLEVPNLTSLKINITSALLIGYSENLESLENCPLEQLQICITERDLNLVQLFNWIEIYQRTLKTLSIDWTRGGEANFPLCINLPHLKQLVLRNMYLSYSSSFEFLSGLCCLKQLKIHFTYKCYNEILEMMGQAASSMRTRVIDMHQFFDKLELEEGDGKSNHLYRSNVWSLVPALEMITLSHSRINGEDGEPKRTYTRQEMPSMFRPFKMGRY